jgi:hypothetical protein
MVPGYLDLQGAASTPWCVHVRAVGDFETGGLLLFWGRQKDYPFSDLVNEINQMGTWSCPWHPALTVHLSIAGWCQS